jgi:3-phosphoshikimate 1-carboxyvinyltransferase
VTASRITVSRLFDDCQGERAVVPVLQAMGVGVEHEGDRVELTGPHLLKAIEFDGDKATDMVLAMVATACMAQGTSRFYNVANLRLKECDRIDVPALELARLGVAIEAGPDYLAVTGRPDGYEGGIEVGTHHDHRVAQMLAIVGLRCRRGLTILDAENVAKSYPAFFTDIAGLGARVTLTD